jgi:hypothetical protein
MKNKITLKTYGIFGAFVILSALPAGANEEKPIRSGGTAAESQSIDIKPRWQVGKKFTQTSKTEETMMMAIGGLQMEQKSVMIAESTLAVRAHENGKFKRVSMKYDRIAVEMGLANHKSTYDTAKADDKDPSGTARAARLIIGKEVQMVLDDKDEVIEVENLAELLKQTTGGDPEDSLLGQFFDKEAIKNTIRQSSLLGALGKPVKVGDAWPFSYSVSKGTAGRLFINGNYTLKGQSERAGARCAELEISGEVQFKAPPGAAAARATDGSLSGSAWFDPALGICRDLETTQELKLKRKNPKKPDEIVEIPMKQVVRQTITKVENL